MGITQIDPSKKYVLQLPSANVDQAERVMTALQVFMNDERQVIFVIHGLEVIIVPVDQVVGYVPFGEQ